MADHSHKNITPILLLVIVVGYLLVGGRGEQKESGAGSEILSNESGVQTDVVQRSGTVLVPDDIAVETLSIVSLGEVSEVSADGAIEVPVYENGVSTVAAMIPDRGFGFVDVVIGDEAPELTVQSTAEALVFLSPFLVTNDPVNARVTMSIIQTDEAVTAFALVIERLLAEEGPDLLENELYQEAFGGAIESVLSKLQ